MPVYTQPKTTGDIWNWNSESNSFQLNILNQRAVSGVYKDFLNVWKSSARDCFWHHLYHHYIAFTESLIRYRKWSYSVERVGGRIYKK